MITLQPMEGNMVRIQVAGKLEDSDFKRIAPQIDQFIASHGHLNLVIDATGFEGWSNMEAAKRHFGFVREHQKKIDRIAVIAGHAWQHWVAGIAGAFVHPQIKVFDKEKAAAAENWARQMKAAA